MLADLDEADIARVRAHACQRFTEGKVAAAQRVYFVLTTLDQWSFDDWFGLGLCYQRLGQHEQALPCFAKAGVIRASDPRAPYLAGLSYERAGNREFAIKAYRAALRLCAAEPQHATLARSASARCEALDIPLRQETT
ncbi:tetratricopeptide repeat protein [Pandoraea sp. PE-S2R-1]|uniref:tetratricopeptide repeat protein n=1 Tax=Pandoraea sp. PE-S2R-1 TaxID=1986994 RepID=UPI0011321C5B|nr:tetratricopeptide repeat protein [Pandoraea sp. PE-S2R-1]